MGATVKQFTLSDVYDVSHSKFWKEGGHYGLLRAGVDLTQSLANAPHPITVHFSVAWGIVTSAAWPC